MKFPLNRTKSVTISSYVIFYSLMLILLASCSNSKRVAYFRDVPDDTLGKVKVMTALPFVESKIQPNDLLIVSLQTIDPQATEALNKNNNSKSESGSSSAPTYTVDKEGYVEMPIVGRVLVANHTTSEARDIIREKAKRYFVEPIVNVTYANFFITIIGDITRPGRLMIPNEKISIIDAIGLASDLSITAQRKNIMLIREESGQRVFARYDINSTEIFNSPYYYLHSGDILYIEPINAKKRAATADVTKDRYISYGISFISLFLTIYSIVLIRK